MVVALAVTVAIAVWATSLLVNRRRIRSLDGQGDPELGTVVFVEPVRWLFIVWGFPWFCRGLGRAGRRPCVRLFRWSSAAGALLVIPDLIRRGRLDRRAARLARLIERVRLQHPYAPINIVGYSSGCYVATEACKRLEQAGWVGRLILLAPSVSPDYDWGHLEERGMAVSSFHSRLDLINIVGPLLFGANDRRWGPASGAVGFKHRGGFLRQRCWHVADVTLGYFGDHFTIASPRFIARHIAPLLAG